MNSEYPHLALIGHGTTGKDTVGREDIERGIHLRWQFRQELGFPLGCFRLYRRLSGAYGTPVNLDFKRFRVREIRKPFVLGPPEKPVKVNSSHWPLILETRQQQRILLVPEAKLTVTFPEYVHKVIIKAAADATGRLSLIAYANGVEVDRSSFRARSAQVYTSEVQASVIDTVVLNARNIALIQISYMPCERCEDHGTGNWEQIAGPLCLPIGYPEKPGKDPWTAPDCEWLNVVNRLPDDPCVRAQYGGDRAKELVATLKNLVDPHSLQPQADRLIETTGEPTDCPPPDQRVPTLRFPVLDAVLLASIDPLVARALGLYFVDETAEEGRAYDYKIVGRWPTGTLWHLPSSIIFDDIPSHRYATNIFPVGELTFRSAIRPAVIDRPSYELGTLKALSFAETDEFDWNFPVLPYLPVSEFEEPIVEIRFPQAVGEVQVYIGQHIPNVTFEAWDDTRNQRVDVISADVTRVVQQLNGRIEVEVLVKGLNAAPENFLAGKLLVQGDRSFSILSHPQGSPVQYGLQLVLELSLEQPVTNDPPAVGDCSIEYSQLTRKEDVMAVHGFRATDQITRIVLKGEEFWIYKICWGEERISHGEHCAFVYDLRIKNAKPLPPPSGIQVEKRQGLVHKINDCQPLLEGATNDARFSVGVSWKLPIQQEQLLPRSPIRYNILRVHQDGRSELVTRDAPVLVTPPTEKFKAIQALQKPEGLPKEPPYYIDSGLEPGTYRYRVQGIDLFGRMSTFSNPSSAITPVPPPPSPPANFAARFVEAADPWLSADDREALPSDINEAIRLFWNWPESYERMSPDITSFNVHYIPGIPNVLLGVVTFVDVEAGTYVDIKTEIENLGAAPAPQNLLVGRLLSQGGKAFRILTHREGIVNGPKQVLEIRLLLPPSPSTNRPALGQCSIGLDASIPIKITQVNESGNVVTAVIETATYKAMPASGLEHATLKAGTLGATITAVSQQTVVDDLLEIQVQLNVTDSNAVVRLLRIPVPFHATLTLPPPSEDIYKDYRKVASWPTDFTASIPKTVVGQYEITVREPSAKAGESPALIAVAPGKYTLITKNLPPGLEAKIETPTRKGHFGVSSVGIGREGAVSTPTGVTRVYRADDATKAVVLAKMKPEPAPQADIVLEGPPNFEGKLTFNFSDHGLSWNVTTGWYYEVHRTLGDTLLRVDESARENIAAEKIAPRFSDEASKRQWLDDNFPAQPIGLKNAIRDLIINPSALDLNVIDNHAHHNVLLQALASLPYNDRAFTKLTPEKHAVQTDPNDATKLTCIDNDIDGRAKGIYFYRVRAFDQAGNATTLGMSTPPIRVVGDIRPTAPVITKIEGGDRKITIRWAAIRDPRIIGYLVYRTDDKTKTTDVRLMGSPIKQQDSDEYSVKVPDPVPDPPPSEYTYEDNEVKPRIPYYYGVVAVHEELNHKKFYSNISEIKIAQAYDLTPPDPPTWVFCTRNAGSDQVTLEWTSDIPDLTCIVLRQEQGGLSWVDVSGWLDAGVYAFTDTIPDVNTTYSYKIAVEKVSGIRNKTFNVRELEVV